MVSIESLIFFLILDVFLVNDYLVKKSSVRLNPGRQFFRALTVVYLVFGAAQHVAAQSTFVTTWQVSNPDLSITIPTFPDETYNYSVDWGDGNTSADQTGDATHTYADPGSYTVSISGVFPRIFFDDDGDKDRIISIDQWGNRAWTSMNKAFQGCINLELKATDAPNLSGVTDMSYMFYEAKKLNSDLSSWNVSTVTNMQSLFGEATVFNGDIESWDVSNVENMSGMFFKASVFNRDIGEWTVSNDTTMAGMFSLATSFSQDISGWDVSNVTNMSSMFYFASSFNQAIGGWDVGKVTDMSSMFESATSFNQIIDTWNVSSVTDMEGMFYSASDFNMSLNSWNVSKVTNMKDMFAFAGSFNGQIVDWNVGRVTTMEGMFRVASAFNQNINNWDVANVLTMENMFTQVSTFNQDISNWDVGSVTNMKSMFWFAEDFNQDIGEWDVSNVQNMRAMFFMATSFNQDIGAWDVGNVTTMESMFESASSFNWDISTWNVGNKVTTMKSMFQDAAAFNQDISGWDVSRVTDMSEMFYNASSFNWDLNGWDVSAVTTMQRMFRNASSFDQDLGSWDIRAVENMEDMFIYHTLSTTNYDATITGWVETAAANSVTLNSNVIFSGGNSKYCASEPERNYLIIDLGWNITDGGKDCNDNDLITSYTLSTDGPICEGENATITMSGSQVDVQYQLRRDSDDFNVGEPIDGTGSELDFEITKPPVSANYHVLATNDETEAEIDNLAEITVNKRPSVILTYGAPNTQPDFIQQSPSISNSAMAAYSVYSVDIDGDGNMDVLSASFDDDKIAWYKNNGSGSFTAQPAITTNADEAYSVYSADLDGDGRMDVLSASQGDNKIAWYKNKIDDDETFGEQQVISNSANGATSVYAADLDGDGDMDVLSASQSDNKIAWYENTNGDGSLWNENVISSAALGAQSVFAADLDGDGDMDVLSASVTDSKIAWYPNRINEGETFGAQQEISTIANGATSVFAADLDGDGDMDVLSGSENDSKVAWHENADGMGTSWAEKDISTEAAKVASVYAADLDRDGDIDVLSASYDDDKIAWYENIDSEGTFGVERIISTAADGANSVFAADLDGDGDIDVMSASRKDNMIAWYQNSLLVPQCEGDVQFNAISNATTPTWTWTTNGSAKINDNTSPNPIVKELVNGEKVTVNVDDENGCANSATAKVAIIGVPTIAATGTDPTTCGGTNGSIEITGLDINTTYEISYTDDGTDVTANMTSNGEGSILVTDLNQGTYNNITATLSGCTSNAAGPVTLSDPAGECINEDFVTIWQVDDITTPFRLPKQGFLPEGKSYTIDWGDGTSDANTYTNVDVPTHSYSTSGAHQITYSGDFTQLRFEDRDDLLGVANWGNTQWTSMNSMFKGCSKFNNIPSTAPDLTFTNDLSNMLQGASSFNQSMANWDVSSITDMSALFYEAASFQGDISGWRVSNVTNMRAMFFRASAFDGDLSQWDVSQVEEMSYMFYNASAFAGDISSWNVSHVTDMSFMFYGAVRFNGDLGNWNVANVTSMRAMFSSATNFPGGINNWNVSNVTDMRTMFSNAQSMSGSLDKWEVSSVTNMVAMFADALSFDGDIGSWDVASVVDMRNMFSGAEQFSSDISGWNVSAVSDMSHMFNGAIAFNADISDWNVFNVLDMTGMFNEASAFNRNLSGWCVGQINKEPTGFDAGTTAWTNPDWRPKWGVSCIPEGAFLSTWEVSEADLSVTVPVVPAVAYNYFVDWGDGYTSSRQTGNAVHTYSEAGTYTISIAGTFPRIYFNNRGDRNKIRFIDQWGDQRWSSMENAFAGCSKLQIAAVDAPNLKFVRNLRGMFKGATSLNSGLGHWDVSSATNMSDMFANTASFNGDVSEWNVGLVRDFSGMFRQATAFDQDLGNWDITNATKMDDMFEGVTLSTEHYDALLIGWAGLDAPPEGITFHGGSSTYCAGDDARKTLQLRHRWRITDGNRSTACILGIEGSLLSQVMLYPNPTQGIVHLQGWEEGKVRTVVIFDLSGRIVIKMDPSNQLNLEHLLEGTYILRLEGNQGLKTFKLIRN
jgi:surface protein